MSWTYDTALTASKDKVRFLVGDTDTNDQLLQNEEITYILIGKSNVYRAAAEACRAIALKLGRELSLEAPAMSWSADDQYQHYISLADKYDKQAVASGAVGVFGGGISVADRDTRDEDTDRVQPTFVTSTHQSNNANELTDRDA